MSDTTQLADAFLLQSTLKADSPVDVSKGKSVSVIYDNNQGSYNSGLITIDATSQLTGSQGFASLKDGYLLLPYVITSKSTTATNLNSNISRFACGLKCNVANIIDSLSVELNGKKVITETEYKGFWNNLRAMTELSQDEVIKNGADLHLYPDSWYSINFSNALHSSGDGYASNALETSAKLDATSSQAQEPLSFNQGFLDRLLLAPPIIDATEATPANSWASFGTTATKQICQQNGKGCFKEYTYAEVTAADGSSTKARTAGIWYHMLKIPLVSLHPIFKELDLCANPQLKLRLRVNAGTVAISGTTTTSGTPSITTSLMKLDAVTMTSGQTVPIMIASAAPGNPMNGVLTEGAQLSFSFGPVGNSFTPTASVGEYFPFTTSRLMVPFYHLRNPTQIISRPVKTIRYLDCFAQMFRQGAGTSPAIPTGQLNAPFDLNISGYKKNVKYVALIPFADTKLGHFATATVPQYQSPFDSAPWTCMPGASIRNFQVTIGNSNVFDKSQEYDFESFRSEFSKLGAINGDLSSEISNGLIDSMQWNMAQRILVADCSRLTKKDVPQAIQVSGINGSATGMDLLVLVVYERELELDRLTGEVHRTD